MRVVPLAAIPGQSFTVTLDLRRWSFRIFEANGVMAADIALDGVVILTGTRLLAGEAAIPYRYLEQGNFFFLTVSDDLPEWAQFGASQILIYLSAAEMAALPQTTMGEIIASQATISYLYTDEGFYLTTDTGELIEDA